MMTRVVVLTGALVVGSTTWFATGMSAQSKPAAAKPTYAPAKTAWGDPNLQGTYSDKDENGIPLERPSQFEGKRAEDLDDSELADIVKERQQRALAGAAAIGGADTGAGPVHWYEHYDAKNSRPWMVLDPPDGRIPPLTPAAQQRAAARAAMRSTHGPPTPSKTGASTISASRGVSSARCCR